MYDVVVIGGGPAGLSGAIVLARARRSVALIDSGEPRNAAAREVHGFLGHDAIAPRDLLALGQREAQKYGVERSHDEVVSAERLAEPSQSNGRTAFSVQLRSGKRIEGRKLLIATGTRDVLPQFPGLRECYGRTVHHCPYCDGWEHRDRRLAAYGTEGSGVGLGLLLRNWSDKVVVLTSGESLSDHDKQRLKKNGIRWCEEKIEKLLHEESRLIGVRLANQETVPCEALFFQTTQMPRSDLPQALGCEMTDFRTRTHRKQKTNVPGIYLAGDADGDVQFAVVAAAEGATAAVAINRELQEEGE